MFKSVLTEGSSWDGGVDLGLTLVGHLVEMTEPRPLMILGLGTASSHRHTLEGLICGRGVDLGLTLAGHLVEKVEPNPILILGFGTASSLRHVSEGFI